MREWLAGIPRLTATTATTAVVLGISAVVAFCTTLTTLFVVFLAYRLFLWATGRPMTCPCSASLPTAATSPLLRGGYKATKRNLKYLRRYKAGKSIGFTMRSSLKAKGLLPRANGTYRVSKKYQNKTRRNVRRQ
jgi:hypothetical protein